MIESRFQHMGSVELPEFTGTRVMMMPFVLGQDSLPESLAHWHLTIRRLCFFKPQYLDKVGYLTIEEKVVPASRTHRRAGLHVDGVYRNGPGAWGGGGWGSVETGMLTVSNQVGCRAWNQLFTGWAGDEGDCEHLREQALPERARTFQPGEAFWLGGLCVHESLPQAQDTPRQFVRVSLPSTAPWFDGYTVNPLGILPTGPILPRREFMHA